MSVAKDRPRHKHVPRRTCVSCRTTSAKRELIRLVRTPTGEVEPDPTGKRPGRGAYLCPTPACWERALAKGGLQHALSTKLSADNVAAILQFRAERLGTEVS